MNVKGYYAGKKISLSLNTGLFLWFGVNSSEYKSYVAREILPAVLENPDTRNNIKYVYINFASMSLIEEISRSKNAYHNALLVVDNAEIVVRGNIKLFKDIALKNTVVLIGRNMANMGLSILDKVHFVDYSYSGDAISLEGGAELV